MSGLAESFRASLEAGSPLAFLLAFAGGVLVSFTPCVYPVLPVTAGYIGSRGATSAGRGFLLSAAYVLGMAATYAALGGVAAMTGQVFGQAAASPWTYLLVGNLCLLLGLSMFDAVRIPLPSFLAGRAGGKRPAGVPGAFGVGVASGLIVGPCTAPVLGALLLYVGARKNPAFGISLLFTFALGMGMLIVLIGTFAGILSSLPKSGAWSERIKKGFGVVLIVSAEYLLVEAGRLLV